LRSPPTGKASLAYCEYRTGTGSVLGRTRGFASGFTVRPPVGPTQLGRSRRRWICGCSWEGHIALSKIGAWRSQFRRVGTVGGGTVRPVKITVKTIFRRYEMIKQVIDRLRRPTCVANMARRRRRQQSQIHPVRNGRVRGGRHGEPPADAFMPQSSRQQAPNNYYDPALSIGFGVHLQVDCGLAAEVFGRRARRAKHGGSRSPEGDVF